MKSMQINFKERPLRIEGHRDSQQSMRAAPRGSRRPAGFLWRRRGVPAGTGPWESPQAGEGTGRPAQPEAPSRHRAGAPCSRQRVLSDSGFEELLQEAGASAVGEIG